jgi:hypothetical protein
MHGLPVAYDDSDELASMLGILEGCSRRVGLGHISGGSIEVNVDGEEVRMEVHRVSGRGAERARDAFATLPLDVADSSGYPNRPLSSRVLAFSGCDGL